MTLRMPEDAADFIEREAEHNFTSKNAEIVRSVRERMTGNIIERMEKLNEYHKELAGKIVVEKHRHLDEIERLEKEVDRWRDIADATEALKQQCAMQRDTSWNDAIEAAAGVMDAECGRLTEQAARYRGGSNPHHELKAFSEAAQKQATAIRDLKRSQP